MAEHASGMRPGSEAPAEADVVVIGAGVAGASIGYQLARNSDLRVAIVDARAPVGGISGRTFGQIRQHYSNEVMVQMAQRGFGCIQNWSSEVGYGDPGYVRLGYLLLVTADQIDGLRRNVELGQRLGVDTSFVGPDEISAIEPLINVHGLAGGAYEPDGGYIDVTKMVLSWLAAASAAGAQVLSGVAVQQIDTDGDAVVGVTTTAGTIRAPVVVAATGAWATDLLDRLALNVPVQRRRLEMAVVDLQPDTRSLHTCVTDGNSNLVIRPDMGRRVVAAAYPPQMPMVIDPLADAPPAAHVEHEKRLRHAVSERMDGLRIDSVTANISGAYDVTPDYHPILGWASDITGPAGLYLAFGFSGHGLKLSPAVGEIVAAHVLGVERVGDAPIIDVHALRPSRFEHDDLMHLTYGRSARA